MLRIAYHLSLDFNFIMVRGKYCACFMNGVTGPSGFMNDVTRPSDFINGVTRPSDGVSSRCLRCQIFEGGVGLAGVGVGGSKPFVQGCIFFIIISPRKFCTTSCKCFTVPQIQRCKTHKWKCFTIPSKVKDFK